jgi:hypothetical protein
LQNTDLEVFGGYVFDVRARCVHHGEVSEGSRGTFALMESRPEPPFGRVLTAIITPFTDDGAVDYATFWKLVRYLGANGSDGVVVGSAIVAVIEASLDNGKATDKTVSSVYKLVSELSAGVNRATAQ